MNTDTLEFLAARFNTLHEARAVDAKKLNEHAAEINRLKAEVTRLSLLTSEREHPITTIFMQAYGLIELDAKTKQNERMREEIKQLRAQNKSLRQSRSESYEKIDMIYDEIDNLYNTIPIDTVELQVIFEQFEEAGWVRPDTESDDD